MGWLKSSRGVPWPRKTPEEERAEKDKHVWKEERKKEERHAYEEAFYKGRVQAAKKRGHQEGLRTGGSHGVGWKGAMTTLGKGLGQAGNYAQNVQGNLGGMFLNDPLFGKPRKSAIPSHQPHKPVTHHKKKAQHQPSIWEL